MEIFFHSSSVLGTLKEDYCINIIINVLLSFQVQASKKEPCSSPTPSLEHEESVSLASGSTKDEEDSGVGHEVLTSVTPKARSHKAPTSKTGSTRTDLEVELLEDLENVRDRLASRDSADTFGQLVSFRIRDLPPFLRLEAEIEIETVLNKYRRKAVTAGREQLVENVIVFMNEGDEDKFSL